MACCASCSVILWIFLLYWSPASCLESARDRLHKRSDDLGGSVDAVLAAHAQKLSALEAKLQTAENTIATLQSAQGSTFVRWGRSTCPSHSTLLYSGIAGGALEAHTGNGANRLCLTKEPVFDDAQNAYGRIEGAEYYIPGHYHNDVVCAVCRTSHSDTFMMPGTSRCPSGSVMQYQGHLTSGSTGQPSATEYLCLDASPEDRIGGHNSEASAYFEYVSTHCGALPCPPYVDAKVVTCAVCSV